MKSQNDPLAESNMIINWVAGHAMELTEIDKAQFILAYAELAEKLRPIYEKYNATRFFIDWRKK